MNKRTVAFGLASAIACIFNTVLAWAKDAYAPLNKFLASLMGHHWITHGVADCVVFFGLGLIFMNTSIAEKINPERMVSIVVWSVAVASVGLFAWFVFF